MIAGIEDAMLARLRDTFGARLRDIDHKPAKLDEAELNRMLTQAPGAYLAFLGFERRERPQRSVDCAWGLYLVAANASGERARRRGDTTAIGGYEMTIAAAAVLEGFIPEGASGPIEIRSAENLFGDAFEKAGRTVYGLVLSLPATLPDGFDPTTLDNFLTFAGDWDIPSFGNVARPPPAPASGATKADAADLVTLPAAD